MKNAKTHRSDTRNHTDKIIFPKIVTSQHIFFSSPQKSSTLSNLNLPKLSSRNDASEKPLQLIHTKTLSTNVSRSTIPILSSSVKSSKPYGIVQLYCANTHKGIIRNCNEDRVMIMLRIPKPEEKKNEKWPKSSFFGLYDGHGGKSCSNFLRDNLHLYISQDSSFPNNPEQAILNGFAKAESNFLEIAIKQKDVSGSCALVVLIVGKKCYVANLGDSRAVMSVNNGKECIGLSIDHKPSEISENQRVLNAGGAVYDSGNVRNQGVMRIMPGRLAISRAFGDFQAKIKEFGGNPNVLIAVPDIKVVKIEKNFDFIALASDGIFDRIENKEIVSILNGQDNLFCHYDPAIKLAKGVEEVIVEAMRRESFDNVTVLAIAFQNYLENCKNLQ